jgi:hypothetical protein
MRCKNSALFSRQDYFSFAPFLYLVCLKPKQLQKRYKNAARELAFLKLISGMLKDDFQAG